MAGGAIVSTTRRRRQQFVMGLLTGTVLGAGWACCCAEGGARLRGRI